MNHYKRTLLVAIISVMAVSALSQSPHEAGINLGYGLWNGLNAGASYRFDRYSAGFEAGRIIGFDFFGRTTTVVMNNNYYFAKKDQSSNKETLIFMNPMYRYTEDAHYISHILLVSAGIGREISLGPALNFRYQGGPILPVNGKIKQKTDIIENRAAFIIPLNLRFQFAFKIGR